MVGTSIFPKFEITANSMPSVLAYLADLSQMLDHLVG